MVVPIDTQDERENVVLMTGALYYTLAMTGRFDDLQLVDDEDGFPVVEVETGFMDSPYRLSVRRVDRPKVSEGSDR